MKRMRTFRVIVGAAVALLACGEVSFSAATSEVDQMVRLGPGWNAVWLEVQPDPNEIETVFAGVPLVSVWTWESGTSRVEFLRDPSEGLLNLPGWMGYFPPGPHEFLTNLHTVQAHRAYLIRLDANATPLTLTVTGRPSARPIRWTPDSFNLVGFPVDPQAPPSFADFFAPSRAHAGQPIYRLGPLGNWEPIVDPYAESIRSGEAYWVFSRGASNYTAPLEIDLDGSDGLDFGTSIVERRLRIRDLAEGGAGVLIRTVSSSPIPLSLWTLDTVTDTATGLSYPRVTWQNLEPEHAVAIPDGDTAVMRLAVRRAQMSSERAEGVLEILDGLGTRLRVAVDAMRSITAAETGLWVGSVTLDEVNEVNDDADPLSPTPTPASFSFRIIVHVDDGGTARLLTQVFQMWEWDDPPANTTGHYVLISDDSKVPMYDPASLRDGDPVSYRISAVAYDFDNDDPLHADALVMEGGSGFGYPATLSFVANLGAASSTNPFVHWYHPDHDTDRQANDIDYDPADPSGVRGGAYDVVRTWTLTFADSDPQDEVDPPDWGDSLVGGTFEETIAGLHRDDVVVRGEFRLWRVSAIGTLNP